MTATEELARLGAMTEAEIAADLKRRHCEGTPEYCRKCPIAIRFKFVAGDDFEAVGCTDIHIGGTLLKMPQSVRDFIRGFDNGKYPDLVAR